jgi:ppGpp synthetase/RelA/SpoT-type nucleotidyltranferase
MKKIEDILREEYFKLLPRMVKIHRLVDTKVRWYLKSVTYHLKNYQRIEIESRIKECDSAITSLRNKQELGIFDSNKQYSLTSLKDLVGARVLIFPPSLINPVNKIIVSKFHDWKSDHEKHGVMNIRKYNGYVQNKTIRSEIQIVSMLTGLFWQVEHFSLYKPDPMYKGIKGNLKMERLYREVLNKLAEFEISFENSILD